MTNCLVSQAKKDVTAFSLWLQCKLEKLVVLATSDAAYGAMPGGASGRAANICHVEWFSTVIKGLARSTTGAEVSSATTAFEHGDFVRKALAEPTTRGFHLRF